MAINYDCPTFPKVTSSHWSISFPDFYQGLRYKFVEAKNGRNCTRKRVAFGSCNNFQEKIVSLNYCDSTAVQCDLPGGKFGGKLGVKYLYKKYKAVMAKTMNIIMLSPWNSSGSKFLGSKKLDV